MSNVGYDLDTSGGLMPLIRALIKPPDEDANAQKSKKPQHPYYKRPGKGHNHDSCDACGEGGDLICCDRCPASFHLGCYDPPLDENDIPAGLWLCKECRAEDAANAPPTEVKPEDKKRSLRSKKRSKDGKDDDDTKSESEKEKESEKDKELTPMEILVKAAKIMNPTQFELPREMRVPCLFPGTEKEGSKNGNATVVTVDSSGCVPLPAKSCFVCSGTCKSAPLLQCDYCPLLFHQDCLDPPLTALPTGRWMCPNHVEQYIDWKMVNSISATERVALWDQFSGPVDQHAIKVDFIRQARKANPAFRIKVPVGIRGRVIVPDMVRYHYNHPPPLYPHRREYVRCRNVLKNMSPAEFEASLEGEKHRICLNLSCPQYKGGECPMQGEPMDIEKDSEPEDRKDSDSELSDSDFEYLTSYKRRKLDSQTEEPRPKSVQLSLPAESVRQLVSAADGQLARLDQTLVKVLAAQRLTQILAGELCAGPWRWSPVSRRLSDQINATIDRAALAKLGYRPVALPSDLLTRPDRERIARAVWGAPLPRAPPSRGDPPSPSLRDCGVRAALCPVSDIHRSNNIATAVVPMRLSRLRIGSDSACEVILDADRCRCVSPRHATIFCDEVTGHFELINYSEWGSVVNGVQYTCDVTAVDRQPVTSEDSADARLQPLKDIVSKRQHERRVLNMRSTTSECRCISRAPPPDAWEGSALVPHAALLQFGCHMFVFSITDHKTYPYEEHIENPAI